MRRVFINRFMPKELSTMLAEYLVIVRPLEVFFSEKFKCKGTACPESDRNLARVGLP